MNIVYIIFGHHELLCHIAKYYINKNYKWCSNTMISNNIPIYLTIWDDIKRIGFSLEDDQLDTIITFYDSQQDYLVQKIIL